MSLHLSPSQEWPARALFLSRRGSTSRARDGKRRRAMSAVMSHGLAVSERERERKPRRRTREHARRLKWGFAHRSGGPAPHARLCGVQHNSTCSRPAPLCNNRFFFASCEYALTARVPANPSLLSCSHPRGPPCSAVTPRSSSSSSNVAAPPLA